MLPETGVMYREYWEEILQKQKILLSHLPAYDSIHHQSDDVLPHHSEDGAGYRTVVCEACSSALSQWWSEDKNEWH